MRTSSRARSSPKTRIPESHRKGSNDRTSDEYDLRPLIVMLHAIAEDLEGRQVYWNDELVEVPGSAS